MKILTNTLQKFDELLIDIVNQGGSDLHLTADSHPFARLHGELKVIDEQVYDMAYMTELVAQILTKQQQEKFEQLGQIDFGYSCQDTLRFRGNFYRSMGKTCVAMRYLSDKLLDFESLGLPEYVKSLPLLKDGLVLVTGATGSGKSTTLAAILNFINQFQNRHIITIEDPVEFLYKSAKSIVHQREVNTDVDSFAGAVRAALREDPDVILVGELRDRETVQAAISAAETGHLVFATLHTNDAVGAIDRMVGFFPGEEQGIARNRFGMCLRSILAQRLVKLDHGLGRSVALEILHVNKAVSNLIAKDKGKQIYSVIETSRSQGMQTLDQSLADLVKQGKVTPNRGLEMANFPEVLERLIRAGSTID